MAKLAILVCEMIFPKCSKGSGDDMRVVALGGCGGMGQFAVRTALGYDFLEEIVIADRDGDRARSFAEECGPKANAIELDIEDAKALTHTLKEADVVLTTVGPYYRFGVPILKAAIEARCHYIDINDDWEPTLEMLALDEEARKAGITAIVGMGASPGISNMLAAKAMSLLDSVEDLITGWGIESEQETNRPGEGGSFGAAVEHWVHQFTGKIRVRRNGEFEDVVPIEEIKIDYPDLGTGIAHTVGHPEPLTIPLYRREIRNSCNVMVLPPELVRIIRWLAGEVDSERMTVKEAAAILMKPEKEIEAVLPLKLKAQIVASSLKKPKISLPELFAWAKGMKDGERKTVAVTGSAAPAGGMGGATGVPMALGLSMFAGGKIEKHGVFAPEMIIDPDSFFDELAPLCTPERANATELLIITSQP